MKTLVFFAILFAFIQAPLDFVHSPQVRLLPPGETIIYSPIILSSGQSLIGDNSTLTLADGANCPVIIVGDSFPDPRFETTNVYISNIKINGNHRGQRFEGWGGDPNVSNKHAIRNSGVVIRRSSRVLVDNISVDGAASGGIVVERDSKDVTVMNCRLNGSVFDGIALYESKNVFISDSAFTNNGFAGFSADLNFNNNLIYNCSATGNLHQGIFLRHSSNNHFRKMTISKNGNQGIFIAKSELPNSEARNNIFSDLSFFKNLEDFRVNDKECLNNILIRPVFWGQELATW